MTIQLRSSNIGHCARKWGYDQLGTEAEWDTEPDSEPQLLMDGWWHEYEVKHRLLQRGVEFEAGLEEEITIVFKLGNDWLIPGHLDGVVTVPVGLDIPQGRYVLEVKSMGGAFWQFIKKGLRQSHPHYFDQVQSYLGSFGVTSIIAASSTNTLLDPIRRWLATKYEEIDYADGIPSQTLVVVKDRSQAGLRMEIIDRDETAIDTLRRRWVAARRKVEQGELPQRHWDDPNNWECRRCPFKVQCWEMAQQESPENVEAITDAELLEAADLWVEGKRLEKQSEELLDRARPILELPANNKYTVGPLSITKGTRNLTTYEKAVVLETKVVPYTQIRITKEG